jgi:hypothetical protein
MLSLYVHSLGNPKYTLNEGHKYKTTQNTNKHVY